MKMFALAVLLLAQTNVDAASRHPKHRRHVASQPSVSLRQVLEAEASRDSKSKTLFNALKSPSVSVVKNAIIALGRIGDPVALEPLSDMLNKKDKGIRLATAFSMGIIGGDVALKLLGQHAEMHKEGDVTGAILTALGRAGNESTLPALTRAVLNSKDKDILYGGCQGLGLLWSGDSAKWTTPDKLLVRLTQLATAKESYSVTAAFALGRYKGDWKGLTAVELGEAVGKAAPPARAHLIRALGKMKAPVSVPFLLKEVSSLSNPSFIKIEALKALGLQEYSEKVGSALGDAANDKESSVATTALDTIGSFDLGTTALTSIVQNISKTHSSRWVRATALKNLARINPTAARADAKAAWEAPKQDLLIKGAAAYAYARMGTSSDLDQLADWLSVAEIPVVIEALDGLASHSEEKITSTLRVTLKKLLEKADVGVTSQISGLVEQHRWKDFAPILTTIYQFFTAPDTIEGKVAILNALSTAGDSSSLEIIKTGLKDSDRLVVVAAVKAMKAITGKDESAQIPLNSSYPVTVPTQAALQASSGARIAFKTNRGEFVMRLNNVAPLTSTQIVKFARDGFYDKKRFHRVVPNFVVQGGDPRGDGFGGPGFLIRDEVSSLHHDRATVGIATAGKDTGGCQFFVNLGSNPHLEGRYTVFGEVVSGMDIVDKLEIGDEIITARVL